MASGMESMAFTENELPLSALKRDARVIRRGHHVVDRGHGEDTEQCFPHFSRDPNFDFGDGKAWQINTVKFSLFRLQFM